MSVLEGIVEVAETRSRRRANELLALGYRLVGVDAVTHTFREGTALQYRRSHEYVFGRTEEQQPLDELFAAMDEERRVARERGAGSEGVTDG